MRPFAATLRRESGQLTLMILGFVAIAVMAVAVVVNASNAFVQRRSLSSWADGAVIHAAQGVSYDALYTGVPLSTVPLSESAAVDAVAGYVVDNDLYGRFSEFRVVAVEVDEASGRVSVELAATVPLTMMGEFGSVSITAEASAVAPFG